MFAKLSSIHLVQSYQQLVFPAMVEAVLKCIWLTFAHKANRNVCIVVTPILIMYID